MLTKDRDTCPHCDEPLDDPLAKARGAHIDCSDSDVIEK